MTNKWDGFHIYDRPLGLRTEGIDDGRPVAIVSDFSKSRPVEALSRAGELGKWSLADYATDEFSGVMLDAPRNRPAADVELELGLEGWYAVYVWVMGGDSALPANQPDFDCVYSASDGPALKLNGDRDYTYRFKTLSHDLMFWPGIEACFWRYADLTRQRLHIRHQGHTVHLAAIQCIPLSPAEVEALQADCNDRRNKRLIVKTDFEGPSTEHLRFIEYVRHGDLRGWIIDAVLDWHPRQEQALGEIGSLLARELDIDWFITTRIIWSSFCGPLTSNKTMDFYNENPQWHCRDRDGTDTFQMSFAFPQVQEYVLDVLRRRAALNPNGIGVEFNRDPGLVLFEQPVVDAVRQRTGKDARALRDDDPDLLAVRAEFITQFMRDLRKQADPSLKVVALTLGTEAANRLYSLDVPRWIREGLVDVLCPYPWSEYPDRMLAQGFKPVDVRYYACLTQGTGVELYPMWLSGAWRQHWAPEHIRWDEYFVRALRDYEDGADGISTWDAVGLDHSFKADRWLRCGHRDKLREWIEHDDVLPRKLRLATLGGSAVCRFPRGTGG